MCLCHPVLFSSYFFSSFKFLFFPRFLLLSLVLCLPLPIVATAPLLRTFIPLLFLFLYSYHMRLSLAQNVVLCRPGTLKSSKVSSPLTWLYKNDDGADFSECTLIISRPGTSDPEILKKSARHSFDWTTWLWHSLLRISASRLSSGHLRSRDLLRGPRREILGRVRLPHDQNVAEVVGRFCEWI